MPVSRASKLITSGLIVAAIAFYLYGLGRVGLLGPDEPRYAQVAREMFDRADPVTPTLGNFVWFEKPSLLYWLMIASYRFFGVSEFSARFPSALAGIATMLLLVWLGIRVSRVCESDSGLTHLGYCSGLAFASSIGAIAFSRAATFDIVLTCAVAAALALFLAADLESEARKQRNLLVGFYCAIGLALLAKGLLGLILPGGTLAIYFLLQRRMPQRRLWLSTLWGSLVALGVAATWYGPVIAEHGWSFIHEFFIEQHFARYTSNKFLHPEPFWFFVPVILGLALPWTPMVLSGLGALRRWQWRVPANRATQFEMFAISWTIWPVLFFSLSGSKLPGYVLPALPGAMLLAGAVLSRFITLGYGVRLMQITGALLTAAALAAAIFLHRRFGLDSECLLIICLPILLAGIANLFLTRLRELCVALIFVAVLLSSVGCLDCLLRVATRSDTVRDLLRTANARGYRTAPVLCLHTIEHGTEFYAAGRISRDAEGHQLRYEGVGPVLQVAKETMGPVLVLVPQQYSHQLTESSNLMTDVLGNNGRLTLIAVQVRQ